MAEKKVAPKAAKKTNGITETPEARFQRLATARVKVAIKRVSLIGNLGGVAYKSTPEQRAKIKEALQQAVDVAVMQLNREKAAQQVFTL